MRRPGCRRLCLARAGYGALLLLRPSPFLRLASAENDAHLLLAARLLGVRHVAQALVTALLGTAALRAGAVVDAAHAVSMAGVAAADKPHRKPAAASAVVASTAAAAGFLTAARENPH